MKRIGLYSCVAVAALLVVPALALGAQPSPLVLTMGSYAPVAATPDEASPAAAFAAADDDGAPSEPGFAPAPPPSRSTYYRPRRRVYRERGYGPATESYSQLHLGFFDPEGDPTAGFLAGFRAALVPDPHIQIGGNLDWHTKQSRESQVISEGPGPGGSTITTRRELARSSANLFPLLGFIQVGADADLGVIPYFGVGAGYEVLFLSAEDFQTGESFEGTFGGFGWQIWGGVALPLSGRSRLTTELFLNQADLGRDVQDAMTGETFRETVNMNGAGMRLGLAWGF